MTPRKHNVYFSQVFGVAPAALEGYGAFNITLVNDLPLFIDPFLLYDSKDSTFQALHDQIIDYLCFLRDRAVERELSEGEISHWFLFKEVRQNWLGFSLQGNRGTGLGADFAKALSANLRVVFSDFGSTGITASAHMEKLGLLNGGVGRDHLSDFTTNLIKHFLCEYTERFAREHIAAAKRSKFTVDKVALTTRRGAG
jgi:hypothetical protein